MEKCADQSKCRLSMQEGTFRAVTSDIVCHGPVNRIDLIYTAKSCHETNGCTDFRCVDKATSLPDQVVIVAYDPVRGIVFLNKEVSRGEQFSIYTYANLNLAFEVYDVVTVGPAQTFNLYQVDCAADTNVGCFTGIGSIHYAGWQGVQCPIGMGTVDLDYSLEYYPSDDQSLGLIYSEWSLTASNHTTVIPLKEWNGNVLSANSKLSKTITIPINISEVTETQLTAFGLTEKTRDLCTSSLEYVVKPRNVADYPSCSRVEPRSTSPTDPLSTIPSESPSHRPTEAPYQDLFNSGLPCEGFKMNENATYVENAINSERCNIRLTAAEKSTRGSAFYSIDPHSMNWDCFQVQFGYSTTGGTAGGNYGVVFAIHQAPGGLTPGFQWRSVDGQALLLDLYTYNSWASNDRYKIALWHREPPRGLTGKRLAVAYTNPRTTQGRVWLEYKTGHCQVYFNRTGTEKPLLPIATALVDLNSILDFNQEVYAGFVAITSFLQEKSDEHVVTGYNFSSACPSW